MRQQGNGDALGTGRLVIPGDGGRAARGLSVGPDEAALARKPVKRRRLAERSAPLWLTATFFAAMWACDVQAGDLSRSGDGSVRLAQASTHDSAELQAAPDEGQQKAEMLVRELANAWRDLEVLLNLLNKTRDEQVKAKQAADKEAAELRTALQRAYEAQTRQASDQATELKTAQSSAADLRKSLQQERDRANQLEQDLAAAKREEAALAAKASDEAARLQQAAEISTADQRKSLQQERDRASRLERDLAAAKRDVEAQTALATKAGDEAGKLKQATESSAAEQRNSLVQEWERAARLQRDLAAARRDVETQTALAASAHEETSRLKQIAEQESVDLRKALQLESDKAERLEGALALARTTKDASAVTVGQVVQDKQTEASGTTPVATVQVAVGDARAPSSPEDVADAARLVARANVLLAHGNIGSARVVLQRAADAGDAQASFLLAETYDPLILPKWGTFGTRGDVAKALDLYAKAQAGGIEEAKERSDALRR